MVLQTQGVWSKLELVESQVHQLLRGGSFSIPDLPGRDVEVRPIAQLPARLGLSTTLGQQKLLHDLANIELQAMELGLRSLIEFPWAPQEFRENLGEIILEEAKHLRLCLEGIESLGGQWGQWPVHLGLWHATHAKDTLLQRIFIVHRYLEGSGLDAGDTLLRRLSGVKNKVVRGVVKVIVDEEIGHVAFGSRWFREQCQKLKVDNQMFFTRTIMEIKKRHPRNEKIAVDLRRGAGFDDSELDLLSRLKQAPLA